MIPNDRLLDLVSESTSLQESFMELVYFELKSKEIRPEMREALGLPASSGLEQDLNSVYSDLKSRH